MYLIFFFKKDTTSYPLNVLLFEKRLSVGEDVKKLESLCKADRNVKQCSNYGKQHGISSQNLKKD